MKTLLFKKSLFYSATILPLLGCNAELNETPTADKPGTAPPLMNTLTLSPGQYCDTGGFRLQLGSDLNLDGRLQESEITKNQYICNGHDGNNGSDGQGINSLTSHVALPAGEACANGGFLFSVGQDKNNNDILEANEIDHQENLCHGEDGVDGQDGESIVAQENDFDEDGLPSWFEFSFETLDPYDAHDAALDFDLDGWSNLDEFRQGTQIDNNSDTPLFKIQPPQKETSPTPNAEQRFGHTVTADGQYAVIGEPGDNAVHIYFQAQPGDWHYQTTLTPSDGAEAGDMFGNSVALFENTLVVGSVFDNVPRGTLAGSAYIFTRDENNQWHQQIKLTASDGAHADYFGESVAVSEDTISIGAYADDDRGYNSGSIYIFKKNIQGVWTQQHKLNPNDGATGENFGFKLSLEGNTLVVGARLDNDRATQAGSAYIYTQNAQGIWTQHSKLTDSVGEAYDYFGEVQALHEDTLAIGVWSDNDQGTSAGSVHVYQRDGHGTWNLQTKLYANDASVSDYFGWSVDLMDDVLVVGSKYDDDRGLNSGSAYVFTRDQQGQWTQQSKITMAETLPGDAFGQSISVTDHTVIVGARHDDERGFEDAGSAYFIPLQQP